MLDAIRRRRSVRHYQDRPIPQEVIELLQEAALRAPTSRNLKPWRFVFVTDPELLLVLAECRPRFADSIGRAPLGIVVCAEEATSDTWIEDAAVAAATLQLAATELELSSCWVQIRARDHENGSPAEEYVREVLGLDAGLKVLTVLSIGYPIEPTTPKERDSLSWDKVELR
jgi:nitroreductase